LPTDCTPQLVSVYPGRAWDLARPDGRGSGAGRAAPRPAAGPWREPRLQPPRWPSRLPLRDPVQCNGRRCSSGTARLKPPRRARSSARPARAKHTCP